MANSQNKIKKTFIKQIKPMNIGVKLMMIVFGIIIYAVALKWFVYPSNILPTGLTGLSYLSERLVREHLNIEIPITVFNVAYNAIPAILCFFIVGKAFTIESFIILFSFSFIADYLPSVELTKDPIVCAIFGGILCGYSSALWFRCGTSSGGTDFIAMALSSKFHVQTFGYVMAFNIILIIIQGIFYGWEFSFYSIIYQYVLAETISLSYRHYDAKTILVITTKIGEISECLIEKTGHSSTMFEGIGTHSKQKKSMLYTIVTQPEVRKVINIIKRIDPLAFINIIDSNDVQGNFKYLPVNKDDIDTNFDET